MKSRRSPGPSPAAALCLCLAVTAPFACHPAGEIDAPDVEEVLDEAEGNGDELGDLLEIDLDRLDGKIAALEAYAATDADPHSPINELLRHARAERDEIHTAMDDLGDEEGRLPPEHRIAWEALWERAETVGAEIDRALDGQTPDDTPVEELIEDASGVNLS